MSSLDWLEIFQIDIDVREVLRLCLVLLIHLHNDRKSLLLEYLN